MRSSRFLTLASVALLYFGCSSTNSKDDTTPGGDGGAKADSSNVDTGKPTADTSVAGGDTTTPPSETSSKPDAPGSETKPAGGCDKHPGDECDMVKQNCADATATCDYDAATKHNICRMRATGTSGKSEACKTDVDCDQGLFCFSGKCSPACCPGDNSVCGPGGECRLNITDDMKTVIFHACVYNAPCKPFKMNCPDTQVCTFSEEPDLFACVTPTTTGGLGVAPGGACEYTNDCGESQACLSPATDAGAGKGKCALFCYLTTPDGGVMGGPAKGRFPANGTCMVAGKSYGECKGISWLGGGLGVCVLP